MRNLENSTKRNTDKQREREKKRKQMEVRGIVCQCLGSVNGYNLSVNGYNLVCVWICVCDGQTGFCDRQTEFRTVDVLFGFALLNGAQRDCAV